MNKELKTRTFLYAFAMGLSVYAWWANGALAEDHFMIWMVTIFLVGAMEVFGYAWDMAVFAFNKLRGK